VIDFDAETGDDPQQHGEYAMQTFQYYKVGAGRLFIIFQYYKVGAGRHFIIFQYYKASILL
jgi:hypothetical protein